MILRNATQRNATQRNATPKPLLALVFAAFSLCAAPSYAETAAVVETNETLMPKGMWKDPATGLIWDRCSLGQKWDGKTCVGEAEQYRWNHAKRELTSHRLGGYADWQLPELGQLFSIAKCHDNIFKKESYNDTWHIARCANQPYPTLDSTIFPNSVAGVYWSSSPNNDSMNGVLDGGHALSFGERSGRNGFAQVFYYARAVRTSDFIGREAFLKLIDARFKEVREQQEAAQAQRAREQAEVARLKREQEEADRQRMAREQAAYNQRVAAFRRSVQVGDDTSQGVVIEIKGALIKIQTNESQCTQRDYRGDCANWMNTPVEKWVKRSEIYPQ